ncbi:MAG TPA: aminotransferase class III-fold pyridoxal phosphate-dependent enzyme, partial [Verrucomicrobiae bacterium]
MTNEEWVAVAREAIMNNVGRFPIVINRGKGSRVWDADGKEYIDFLTGISVDNFGHSEPRIAAAIAAQAERIVHVSNYFYLEDQIKLARELLRLSGFHRVYFGNS